MGGLPFLQSHRRAGGIVNENNKNGTLLSKSGVLFLA